MGVCVFVFCVPVSCVSVFRPGPLAVLAQGGSLEVRVWSLKTKLILMVKRYSGSEFHWYKY